MSDGAGSRFSVAQLDGLEVGVLSIELEPSSYPDSLTPAERDVARGLFLGETYDEVALRRGTSKSTVASQVRVVFKKLGVDTASELVAMLAVE